MIAGTAQVRATISKAREARGPPGSDESNTKGRHMRTPKTDQPAVRATIAA